MSATNVRNVSPAVHFLAGGISGLSSCMVVQPFDLVKTRLQQTQARALASHRKSPQGNRQSVLYYTVRKVVRDNGVSGLWRGTWPTVLRNSPGSAAYFAILNQFKQAMAKVEHYLGVHPSQRITQAASYDASRSPNAQKVVLSNTGNLIAGSSARALVGFMLMPVTVIKVRFESDLYRYNSLYAACRHIYAQESIRGFFAGYIPTLLRDAPYAGLYIAIYEQFKLSIPTLLRNSANLQLPAPVTGMTAGMFAGVIATCLTQPFDMIKTRMQLKPDLYTSTLQSAKRIFRDDGIRGYFRGAGLRIMRKAISTSISWTVYEEIVRWDLWHMGDSKEHLDLLTITRDIIHDLPATSHKPLLLGCFCGLTVVFLAILWPLERIAEYEHQSTSECSYRTSAREHLRRRGSF
ncbi:hypothetical protein IWQ62_002994 [Dispira parvispora]|uniref:Mitochondrial glycine transporter n=1 Tax=Dispira parvispora TaxID=1520584 RepID=A0A9W8AQ80_9FUNG|nr:hypothetical protein IWQ62_002994 [Dispira parvispora]